MGQTNSRTLGANKHGAYNTGFLPCDKCISNSNCERFIPKARCIIEQETFDRIVGELTAEFELDSLADKILLERAAMYLIKILRAEAYDAGKGISENGSAVGLYIARLDTVLRALFNDLAMSRGKRKQLQRGEALLVSLDDIVKKFAKPENPKPSEPVQSVLDLPVAHPERKRLAQRTRRDLLYSWQQEYPQLKERAGRGRTYHGQR